MSFSGLPNMIPISERSKVEKTQSNYHTAVTSREIALLAVNVNWGLDSFINESQVMRNTSLSLHWLLVKSPVILQMPIIHYTFQETHGLWDVKKTFSLSEVSECSNRWPGWGVGVRGGSRNSLKWKTRKDRCQCGGQWHRNHRKHVPGLPPSSTAPSYKSSWPGRLQARPMSF